MESATAFGSSSIRVYCKSPNPLIRSSISAPNFLRFASKSSPISPSSVKYSPISYEKQRHRQVSLRRGIRTVVRASLSSSDFRDSPAPVAPLRLESPTGQFLSQILASHPHLVPAAVEQQLEQLESDRDAEKQKEEPSATGTTDLVLYRRIAEVKANERKKALEEILYALVVQKFINANVSLIPTISPTSESAGRVDSWGDEDEKLQHLHSPEAYEMVQNHLSLILGSRLDDSNSVAQISKLRVGQVYAASIMYGYFLKRIDQRFQLEKTMKILPGGSSDVETIDQLKGEDDETLDNASSISTTAQIHPEVTTWSGGDIGAAGSTQGVKSFSRLRNYVMTFDGENLQRFATIRSKEAVSIIEKHTEALFGRPEIVITPQGTIDSSKDEQIKISFGGLRRLVLEAVTFGSFLWDAESYVDTRYHFVAN